MTSNSLRILKRRLTDDEVVILMKLIRETPNITGYSYREWQTFKNLFVAESADILVGVCVTEPLYGKWEDVALLYVLDAYRRHGIGSELFRYAFRDLKSKKKNIYVTSRNPVVIALMKEYGMKEVRHILMLPILINLHNIIFCCSVYRLTEFIRKRHVYGAQPPFVYAYKLARSAQGEAQADRP